MSAYPDRTCGSEIGTDALDHLRGNVQPLLRAHDEWREEVS